MRSLLLNLLLPVVFCLLLTACERRPLRDANGPTEFRVRILTDGISNVTCDHYNPTLTPPTITSDVARLMLFDPVTNQLLSQGFTSEKQIEQGVEVLSRQIILPAGDYRVLGYNFDLTNTKVDGENHHTTLRAYTDEISTALYARVGSRAEALGKIYHEPEHVLVARKEQLHIANQTEVQRVELDARTVVDTYYIQIRVKGMEYLAAKANGIAILSGLAPSVWLGTGTPNHEESAAIYFELLKGTDPKIEEENQDVLYAVFNTFGRIPEQASELQINLTVLARDGSKYEKVVDMEPIFASEDARERHWLLIDEVWEIPKPQGDGDGGFTPAVDDWEDVEEVIPIGPNS